MSPPNKTQSSVNPYVPTLETGRSEYGQESKLSRAGRMTRVLSALMLIGVCVGAAFSVFDVESIMASGPILFIAGAIHFVVSRRCERPATPWIGPAVMLFCVAVFLTIYLSAWSPDEAQAPVASACVVFAIAIQVGWLDFRPNSVKSRSIDSSI